MKQIGVLYGGKTGEHEVSCRSAASVYANLDRSLFEPRLIGIDGEGVWYLQDSARLEGSGPTAYLGLARRAENVVHALPGRGLFTAAGRIDIDLVFPVLHGTFGEDGTIQGLLELVELPYAGAGVLGSAIGMDKTVAKRLWEQAGLAVVPYIEVSKRELTESGSLPHAIVEQAQRELGFPLFVKPVCAGSSVGVSKVTSTDGLGPAVALGLRYDTRVLLERSIVGKEIECSVVGNTDARACTPGEIVAAGAFYDYVAKYVDPDGAQLIIPADLPKERLEEVRSLAVAAYRATAETGMARVDFLLDGGSGRIYLNEINTIPGFTNISMFSRMCEADGVSYRELLTKVIELGFEQFRERRSVQYAYEGEGEPAEIGGESDKGKSARASTNG